MNIISKFRYLIVDVFAENPLEGNPLAVFPDASGIDDITMQKIAKELNLSETTFVLPAARKDCAARVRIFTPDKEMDFAGHPTIGTAYVLIKEKIAPQNITEFMLEERVGPVFVKIDSRKKTLIWLRTPKISEGPFFEKNICANILGLNYNDLLDIRPQLLSAGNPTVFIALNYKDAVDHAALVISELGIFHENFSDPLCVFVFTPTPEGAYSRMFAHEYGVAEDPATGSSTGPLALYMMKNRLISSKSGTAFISEQGTKMGRRSILHVHIKGDYGKEGIYVGGNIISVAEAVMNI